MKLYYKPGYRFLPELKIKNFSVSDLIPIEFNPEDLFIEMVSDEGEDENLEYVKKFVNDFGDSKSDVINILKDGIDKWSKIIPTTISDKLCKEGSVIVSKLLNKMGV